MFVRILRALSVMAVITAVPDDVISLNNDVIPRDVFPDDVISLNNDVISRDVFPDVGEYFYVGVPMNWTEAFVLCQASNAHLAVIETELEKQALRSMMRKHGAQVIHLGFHDQFMAGKYKDILGVSIDAPCRQHFTEWSLGHPQPGSNCGGMMELGWLETISCDDKKVFICEIPTPRSQETLPCYTLVPGFGYYKLISYYHSWQKHDDICTQDGAHLLIINSQAEIDALFEAKIMRNDTYYHVGVQRFFGGNGDFVTVQGDSLKTTGYSTWRPDHPAGTFISYPFVEFYTGYYGPPGLQTTWASRYSICELELSTN